jgi:DnaA family protein
MGQLALPLQLADHAVFSSFLSTGNEPLVAALEAVSEGTGEGCWIWGRPASGKTHLLQAVCERAGDRAVYVPLALMADAGPGVVDGLASRDIVCLDDVDAVAGDDAWEHALFELWNQVHDADGQLAVAAAVAPRESGIALADLRSRMTRLQVYRLRDLDEPLRVEALQLRARHRGLELPAETARYMLNRSRRDMASLYQLLDKLDLEALRAKRRLTIPFVGGVLRDSAAD